MKRTENILAVESVGQGISLAYGPADQPPLDHEILNGFSAKHHLLSLIKQMTNKHGPADVLACALGPGSFTGLRISCVAIRSLAWAWRLPVHCIDTMQALALNQRLGLYICLMPLKRDTTFIAAFKRTENGTEQILACQAILDEQEPALAVLGDLTQYTLIGPALKEKPDLVDHWKLNTCSQGSAQALNAEMVLHACKWSRPQSWDAVLPAYHQASAPELQRAQKP